MSYDPKQDTPTAPSPATTGRETAFLAPDSVEFDRFARAHPFASLFSSPPWLSALRDAYDLEIAIAARIGTGGMTAALPFCRHTDWQGRRHSVLPFSDFADALVDDPLDFDALIDAISRPGWSLSMKSLRNPLPDRNGRLELCGQSRWHGTDTRRPETEIWDGLEPSARQNIRRARRDGVTVRFGRSLDDIRLFHRMHVHLRKSKYRLLAQPLRFMETLHRNFQRCGEVTVAIAEIDGTPLAGILTIGWNGILYYKFNASFDTRHRPNDLLTWAVVRHAARSGYQGLDFGLSETDQPGLIRYKRKFATSEGWIKRHRLPGPEPVRNTDMATVLGTMTELMTRPEVPDTITQEAGDALYRFFA